MMNLSICLSSFSLASSAIIVLMRASIKRIKRDASRTKQLNHDGLLVETRKQVEHAFTVLSKEVKVHLVITCAKKKERKQRGEETDAEAVVNVNVYSCGRYCRLQLD